MNTRINNKISKFIRRIATAVVVALCVSSYSVAFAGSDNSVNGTSDLTVVATAAPTSVPDALTTAQATPMSTPNYQSHQKQRVGDFEVRFNYAFETATITNYFGESNEMIIPEEIDGYKVIRFNCDGMSEEVKQRIVSLHFPKTLKSVYTHYSLDGKTRARLYGFTNLGKITVEEGNETFEVVDGMLVNKKKKALYLCPQKLNVKKVVIPKGIKKIYNNAFMNDYIETVVIGKHVKKVGKGVFKESNVKKVVWNAKCEVIDDYTFYRCKNLKSVKLKSDIKNVGFYAFSKCHSLKKIKFPNTLKSVGWYSFMGCRNLSAVKLGNKVESITCKSFKGCKKLKRIVVPKKTKVDKDVFPKGCKVIRK